MSYTERNDYEVQFDQAITEQNREQENVAALTRIIRERGPRWVIDRLASIVIRNANGQDADATLRILEALASLGALLPAYLRING